MSDEKLLPSKKDTVDIDRLLAGLGELSKAFIDGNQGRYGMRIPAEPYRDGDLVCSAAAHLIERLRAALAKYARHTHPNCHDLTLTPGGQIGPRNGCLCGLDVALPGDESAPETRAHRSGWEWLKERDRKASDLIYRLMLTNVRALPVDDHNALCREAADMLFRLLTEYAELLEGSPQETTERHPACKDPHGECFNPATLSGHDPDCPIETSVGPFETPTQEADDTWRGFTASQKASDDPFHRLVVELSLLELPCDSSNVVDLRNRAHQLVLNGKGEGQ